MFSFTDINNTFSQMVSLDNLQSLIEGTPTASLNSTDAAVDEVQDQSAKPTVLDVTSSAPRNTEEEADAVQACGGMELQLAAEILDLRSALKAKSSEVNALKKDIQNMQQSLDNQSHESITSRKERDNFEISTKELSKKLEDSVRECRDLTLRLSSVNDNSQESSAVVDPVLQQRLDSLERREADDKEEIEQLTNKFTNLKSEHEQLQQLTSQSSEHFKQSLSQLEKSKREVESNVEALTEQLTLSNRLIIEKDQTITSNTLSLEASLTDAKNLKEKIKDLQKRMDAQEVGSAANEEGYKRLIEEMKSSHQADISAKDNSITDLQGKITALTDKLKDVMKKFADLKSKNQALDGAEEKSLDLSKQLQQKESEILSLKLKFENLERTSGDSRVLSVELTEKYGDAQREILKLRSKVQEENVLIASLRKDIESLKSERDQLQSDNSLSSESIQELQSVNATAVLAHQRELSEITSNYDREIQELLEKVTTLQSENRYLQSRAKDDEEMATILEEYKKRAQNALKKANSASASIAAEKAEMQKVIDEVIGKAKISEDIALKAKMDLEIALSNVQENELEISELKSQLTKLKTERQEESTKNITSSVQVSRVSMVENEAVDDSHQLTEEATSPTSSGEDITSTTKQRIPADASVASGWLDASENNESMVALNSEETMHNSFIFPHRGIPQSSANFETSEDVEIGSGVNLHIEKPSSEQLMYINELYGQLDELRKEMAQKCIQHDVVEQELQAEKDARRKLATRVDELKAFLERTKKLQDGPDAVINLEYLKNCIFKFMSSTEHSEKKRLYPVISVILKLTGEEKKQIENALADEDGVANAELIPISSIGAMATNSFESIFGKTSFFSTSSSDI